MATDTGGMMAKKDKKNDKNDGKDGRVLWQVTI